jgi:hypothetical protein
MLDEETEPLPAAGAFLLREAAPLQRAVERTLLVLRMQDEPAQLVSQPLEGDARRSLLDLLLSD